ncbi:hypothetical protein CFIMG_005174RAa [Ceratocystis fimbriata CBS 114723]|uniref:Uncharacterized protein n=1 Tax=Ceratocystis fimbriata CBS 114723 TaxID=1035309 RepID=A0A2C5WXQ4_9PEZI|nr:hypothetical protein CFIMG_005174RAa [Ceratocystis fimbriata CBS 114723]
MLTSNCLRKTANIAVRAGGVRPLTPSHHITWKSDESCSATKRPAYALITGASDGIGLGTATALARQGFSIILLGHLPNELALAKDFIRA